MINTYEFRFYREGEGSEAVEFVGDGRVAYAYLLNADQRIVGDVWLYNSGDTPTQPDWQDRTLMPFANPLEYVSSEHSEHFRRDACHNDLQVTWETVRGNTCAYVHLFGKLFAILKTGSKPGWSRLAAKDGPLAQSLPNMN